MYRFPIPSFICLLYYGVFRLVLFCISRLRLLTVCNIVQFVSCLCILTIFVSGFSLLFTYSISFLTSSMQASSNCKRLCLFLSVGVYGYYLHHHQQQLALLHSTLAILKTERFSLILLILCSAKIFSIRIYKAWRIFSSFKILCNLFGVIPVVNNPSGNVWAVFIFHILISSSFKPVVFLASQWWCSGIVTAGCCYVCWECLDMTTTGLLLRIVLSILSPRVKRTYIGIEKHKLNLMIKCKISPSTGLNRPMGIR